MNIDQSIIMEALDQEVRGLATNRQIALLYDDPRRWRDALQQKVCEVNDQISARGKSDPEWKCKALSSLRRFESRLRDVKRLVMEENKDELWALVRRAHGIFTKEEAGVEDIQLWLRDYKKLIK